MITSKAAMLHRGCMPLTAYAVNAGMYRKPTHTITLGGHTRELYGYDPARLAKGEKYIYDGTREYYINPVTGCEIVETETISGYETKACKLVVWDEYSMTSPESYKAVLDKGFR